MEKEFVQRMKEKMLEEKKQILDSLSAKNDDSRKILEENSARDSIDEAADAVALSMLQSMSEKDMNRLNLINTALTRIETGKYGFCMKCGKHMSWNSVNMVIWKLKTNVFFTKKCFKQTQLKKNQFPP